MSTTTKTARVSDKPRSETLQVAIKRLAKLSSIEFEQQRLAVAREQNVRVSFLEQEVALARGDSQKKQRPGAGRKLAIETPEPWGEPVNLAELLNDTAIAVRRHVVMPAVAADVQALWIAHTYVYERFDHTPRNGVVSPNPRCGKSTMMGVLAITCCRPLKADSLSAAATYRTIEALRPVTLVVDEYDTFLLGNEELRGVADSGFEHTGCAIRVEEINGELQPVFFCTFAPLALAGVKKLPQSIADRAIPCPLQRKTKAEKADKLRVKGARAHLRELGRKFMRWAADNAEKLLDDPPIPDDFGDREGDISVPLLAIAHQAGGDWPQRARNGLIAAFQKSAMVGAEQERLLGDIRTVFGNRDRLPSQELCDGLTAIEDGPWRSYGKTQKPITQAQLARALGRYEIVSSSIRMPDGKTPRGYHRHQFADAWKRYVPDPDDIDSPPIPPFQSATPPHVYEKAGCGTSQSATQALDVAAPKVPQPAFEAGCGGVADQNPPPPDNAGNEADGVAI